MQLHCTLTRTLSRSLSPPPLSLSLTHTYTHTDDEDEAGAPMQLHYSEASSYGSQSASSFAALYSQFVTDDVKVAVRRTSTEDSSIHVSSWA